MPKADNIFDKAITVRIKRDVQTFFILCSEYEAVSVLKGRVLDLLNQLGFTMPK